ncbi:MAG: HAMP domain-containing histidine kinase [Lachnospiraceae bacterium]|nr:HAMP domain-containing histidine kinase [Lachnospiraceae bacterium]
MWRYLKEKQAIVIVFLACACIYFVTFALYHFPLEAVLYPTVFCALLLMGTFIYEYRKYRAKHEELMLLQNLPDYLMESLKKYQKQDDQDYVELIRLVMERAGEERLEHQKKMTDSIDYYTTWVHQIKTPIASMRLRLQAEDSPTARALTEDLFRIEQYVEMVLTYLRLGSESTDYVFREIALDGVIKGCLRKFASQFIGRSLSLSYEGTEQTVVTDEKWLAFVLEQLLSNALKYTAEGGITIEVSEKQVLSIRDTGFGITPEDLPRIFEKGYTGFRGREDKHASGIGLFLCKKICDNLGVKIWAESKLGEGTTMYLDLSQKKTIHE